MWETEIVETEGGLGIVLPDELLKKLNISAESTPCLTEYEDCMMVTVVDRSSQEMKI